MVYIVGNHTLKPWSQICKTEEGTQRRFIQARSIQCVAIMSGQLTPCKPLRDDGEIKSFRISKNDEK